METVLLIFTVLLTEFVYEPIVILRNDQNIKKFYIIFNTFFKEFFEKKFLIYMSFVLFSVLAVIVIEAFLATFIHWSLSFIFSFIILIYCLRPNEFNEKISAVIFLNVSREILYKGNGSMEDVIQSAIDYAQDTQWKKWKPKDIDGISCGIPEII